VPPLRPVGEVVDGVAMARQSDAPDQVHPVTTIVSGVGRVMVSPLTASDVHVAMAPTPSDASFDSYKRWAIESGRGWELGQVRFSSETLENGPSGVRIGTIPRIVLAQGIEGMDS
jgi:hypothetical protein